jgi:glycosyltransferase involved in cell wall biosynthesis
MKFTWLSNAPWDPSGYGQQTRITTTRLAGLGHDIGIICFHGLQGGVMQMGPKITCFPQRFHPYGNDIAVPHTISWGAQFMVSLMDTWVMNPEEYVTGFKWIPWLPVDSDPIPQLIREKVNQAWKRISFSKFGTAQCQSVGMDCTYVPFGIETKILEPKNKQEARERLKMPLDKWIVGTVAMNKGNPSRKNFYEMMAAFAKFHEKYPDTFYWLQTDRGEGIADAVNLPELARNLGLVENQDYTFCNQYQNAVGYPPHYFADLYSAFDVHLLVSAGEGFGLPILEAQACGTPVITGDWTACPELVYAGRKIARKDAEPFYTMLASYQFRPHISAIVDALEEEYQHKTPTEKAVEAIRAEYDADLVIEKYWKPMLAEIEAGL